MFARFNFDSSWAGITNKTAVFSTDEDNAYNVVLEDDMCRIPHEVIKSPGFNVSVYGGDLITVDSVYIPVDQSGLISGVTPPSPTPSVYDQLLTAVAAERAAAAASAEDAAESAEDAENSLSELTTTVNETVLAAIDSITSSVNTAQTEAASSARSALSSEESAEDAALSADNAQTYSQRANEYMQSAMSAATVVETEKSKYSTVEYVSDYKQIHKTDGRAGNIRKVTFLGETHPVSGSTGCSSVVNPSVYFAGKNLADFGNMTTVTSAGITATYDNTTGIVTLNGTKTSGVAMEIYLGGENDRISFLGEKGEYYTVSSEKISGSATGTLYLNVGNSAAKNTADNTTRTSWISCSLSTGRSGSKSAVLPNERPYITHIYLSVSKNYSFTANNLKIKIQLEKGNTKTDWVKADRTEITVPLTLRAIPDIYSESESWYSNDKLIVDCESGTVKHIKSVSESLDSAQYSSVVNNPPSYMTYDSNGVYASTETELNGADWAESLLRLMSNKNNYIVTDCNTEIVYGYDTKQYIDDQNEQTASSVNSKLSKLPSGQFTAGNLIVFSADGGIEDSGLKYANVIDSFGALQGLTRKGKASEVLTVGDRFTASFGQGSMDFTVISVDIDTPSSSDYTHSVTLLGSPLKDKFAFSEPEVFYYADSGLAAGTYSFYVPREDGSETVDYYHFTLTNSLPVNGILMLDWPANTSAEGMKIKAYPSQTSTVLTEEVSAEYGAEGLVLGNATGGHLNYVDVARFGSNVFSKSSIFKYLNGQSKAGSVWTPTDIFDRPPEWMYTKNGFMYDIDHDILRVAGYVGRAAYASESYGESYPSQHCRVSLLSRTEVFGGNEFVNPEGTIYRYFGQNSTLVSPSMQADTNRIIEDSDGAVTYWLRTAEDGTFDKVRAVDTNGNIVSVSAGSLISVVPVITII